MQYTLLEIQPEHDSAICEIIQSVGAEFGTIGEGFGPSDPEVQAMSQHYGGNGSGYFVALANDKVVGGGGFSGFDSASNTCELRKLFLHPEARGAGIGRALTLHCLEQAKQAGYKRCYLDTAKNMTTAQTLYKSVGFEYLTAPLGQSVHHGCDVWMLKTL